MKIFGVLVLSISLFISTFANEFALDDPSFDWQQNFEKGRREATIGVGALFSPVFAKNGRPVVNYGGLSAQLGYMLTSADVSDGWGGNFEILAGLFGAGIFHAEKGNYVAETTFSLRYNFVPPRCKLVPYLQLGAGVTFMDADQSLFGQVLNFNSGGAIGLRYFIKPRCSLNAEYHFEHISNARMSEENLGINAHGGVLSVSWFF